MATLKTAAELEEISETPMTAEQLAKVRTSPRIKVIRRALGLTYEEFSERYRIPAELLREWEAGKAEPDATARAYLEVIAREPEVAAQALLQRDAA